MSTAAGASADSTAAAAQGHVPVWMNTAAYPHQVTYTDVEEVARQVKDCGLNLGCEWVRGPRDAHFERGRIGLALRILDLLGRRDCLAGYLFGKLVAFKAAGGVPEKSMPDLVRELNGLDWVVRTSEQLLAASTFLARPTEVGTFGVVLPDTAHSILRNRILEGENCKYWTPAMVYRSARELIGAAST